MASATSSAASTALASCGPDQGARLYRRHAGVGKSRDLVVDGHDLSRRDAAAATSTFGLGMELVVSLEGLSLSRPSASMPLLLDVQPARPTADNPRHARRRNERMWPRTQYKQTEAGRPDPKSSR